MTGTIINFIAIIGGGLLGLAVGSRLQDRLRQTVVAALGLFTLGFGIQMFIKTQNALVVVGSLLIGAILGEWWRIEDGLRSLGGWLEARFIKGNESGQNHFVRGFLTASLLFCVGPMAILGAIQDGLSGNYQVLTIKSVLDFFASVAFASSLGIGVSFSAIPVFIYQGAIALLAAQVQALVTEPMMVEMNAVGGLILMGLAIGSLLELKPIRAGNFLPGLVVAPIIVALLALFK